MSRLALGIALVGAFLAGGVLMNGMSSRAEDPKPRGVLYPKWRDLGLTRDQIEKIYKVQSDSRTRIAKLEAEIRKIRSEERAEAEKVLTPAQKARLKELLSGEEKPATAPEKDKAAAPVKDK